MTITNKKTKEELEKTAEEIIKKVPEELPEETEEEEIEEVEEVEEEEETEEEETEEEEEEDEIEEEDEDEEEEEEKEPIEKKYKESSREALNLHFKNQKIVDTIKEADTLPEPTEAELKEYATDMGEDYDELEPFAQKMLKSTYINENKMNKISSLVADTEKMDTWVSDVEAFTEDEKIINKYPSLAQHKGDFTKYCAKPQRMGMGLEELLGAFLYQAKKTTPRKKKSVLLKGGGGGGKPAKAKGLSEADLKTIRETKGEKAYKRALTSGKVKLKY